MSGFRISNGQDLDNVFEPASTGMSTSVGFGPTTFTYCPLQFGSQVAPTGYRAADGRDLNQFFAAKGSVGYLANPQTWNTWSFSAYDPRQNGSSVALPNPDFIVNCSSINGTDHMTAVVKVTFNPDGTWIATAATTNRYNDYVNWWNSYGGGFTQTLFNVGQGNFTSSLQSGSRGSLSSPVVAQGNWLKNPSPGAGANYVISASFSAVFDYTATVNDINASIGTNYTPGLRGATSGMNIHCNGGFVVDAAGNTYGSVSNMSLGNAVSICYEFDSSGGFGGNIGGFEGPNAALSWLLWTVASVTLSTAGGGTSASGQFALGAQMNWEQYASGAGTAWPPTYSGGHTLDSNPWAGVSVNPGSQGQFTWTGTGPPGGGVGGGCVEVSMYLKPDLLAWNVQHGQWLDGVDYQPDRVVPRQVTGLRFSLQPCYHLVTESDIEVIASDSTPMTLKDGSLKMFPEMADELVLVDDYGDVRWEPVKSLTYIGLRLVALISMNDQNYFAGVHPYRRVGTHNMANQK